MSIFNKVRNFPEFYDTLDSFDTVRGHEVTIIEGYQKAYGADFEKFKGQQRENYSKGHEPIGVAGNQIVAINRDIFVHEGQIVEDLGRLKVRNENLSMKFSQMQSQENQAKKLEETAIKEETKLNTVRAKGNPVDISKQESVSTAARTKADASKEAAEKAHSEYFADRDQYKKDFVVDLIGTMKKLIEFKKRECAALDKFGDECLNGASMIYYDPEEKSLKSLQDRLAKWEETTI